MTTIFIYPDRCIACGLCNIYNPEIFNYHDTGIIKFTTTSQNQLIIEKKHTEKVLFISHKCPAHAIILKEA
ncbi:MAG: ferredoxin [Lactobacillales bacterium]|jgi:ferredoxin|nr:ferredoxin [Lactobacillales bacterium]